MCKITVEWFCCSHQRWSRGQGHKKSQGQPFRGQTLSRPKTEMLKTKDTSASVLKKKGLQKFFQAFSSKKRLLKFFFQAIYKISTIQKKGAVLEPRTAGNFRGLEAKAKDFKLCPRGLHLWFSLT